MITDIPSWIAEQRARAKIQKQRWDGVDPTYLEEACDLIEKLLAGQAAPAAPLSVPLMVVSLQIDPNISPAKVLLIGWIQGSPVEQMDAATRLNRWAPMLRISEG